MRKKYTIAIVISAAVAAVIFPIADLARSQPGTGGEILIPIIAYWIAIQILKGIEKRKGEARRKEKEKRKKIEKKKLFYRNLGNAKIG